MLSHAAVEQYTDCMRKVSDELQLGTHDLQIECIYNVVSGEPRQLQAALEGGPQLRLSILDEMLELVEFI